MIKGPEGLIYEHRLKEFCLFNLGEWWLKGRGGDTLSEGCKPKEGAEQFTLQHENITRANQL